MRCRASRCTEQVDAEAKPTAAFCDDHWRLLRSRVYDDGRDMGEWLSTAWGSPYWRFALEACVRALRAIEDEQAADAPSMPW